MITQVIFSLFLAVAYWLIIAISGTVLLKKMKMPSLGSQSADLVVGFMLVEGLSFLFFILFSKFIFAIDFHYSFVPIFLVLMFSLFYHWRNRRGVKKWKIGAFLNWKPILGLLFFFISFYLFFYSNQTITGLTNEGFIYQDIVYHSSISNALIEFGYPVADLNLAGENINYHIFTHFICSHLSTISGVETHLVYIFGLQLIGLLMFSIAIVDFCENLMAQKNNAIRLLVIGIFIFLSTKSYLSFYFSYSFQWQLCLLLLIGTHLVRNILLKKNHFSGKNSTILLFLFLIAVVTKGSSLPLLLGGFGILFLVETIKKRSVDFGFLKFMIISTVLGLVIYIGLFSTGGGNGDYINFFKFNQSVFEDKIGIVNVILSKIGISIEPGFLSVLGFLLSVIFLISFRYYIIFFKSSNRLNTFSIGLFLTGLFFYFFYLHNPGYFILPTIFFLNVIFFVHLFRSYKSISKGHLSIILLFLLYSIFQISIVIKSNNQIFSERESSMSVITKEKKELYDWLNLNTNPNDLLATTSINIKPAYMYPATLSKRKFLIGGLYEHLFIPTKKIQQERTNKIESFTPENIEVYEYLKNKSIKYFLVENLNRTQEQSILEYFDLKEKNSLYTIAYRNEGGIILELQ